MVLEMSFLPRGTLNILLKFQWFQVIYIFLAILTSPRISLHVEMLKTLGRKLIQSM